MLEETIFAEEMVLAGGPDICELLRVLNVAAHRAVLACTALKPGMSFPYKDGICYLVAFSHLYNYT